MIPVPGDTTGDAYLNTAEVAQLLGVHRSYVSVLRTRMANGEGSAPESFRFGRTLFTRRSSVARFLEELEHGGEVTSLDQAG
jgi:hypothetical protein